MIGFSRMYFFVHYPTDVLFAILSYLVYVAALICSHLSAFRVATNLWLAVSEHLATLPLGFAETFGSGKLRKIIHESTGAAETFLARQLPDQYNAITTPVGCWCCCWRSTGGCCGGANIKKLLKQGGTFFICNESNGDTDKDDKWTQIIDDMTIYRDAQLKQLLEQAGFRNVQIHKKKSWLCATARK